MNTYSVLWQREYILILPEATVALVERTRPRGRRALSSNLGPIKDPLCVWVGWCSLNPKSCVKCPPIGVVRKFCEGVPDQVSSSSSERGSKLRGPCQNNPRVASKRDDNTN
ncbi:hypothetical protein AVEN_63191-1 [Araneus ventricosus]|uniref:Uncharacterized protein n=1 Tax=Araneus ventricosus TaxID=182803 RepID=A0A4Y2B3I5_ARAVE|nr:hypothetical protein AVEN_63191-1 [Araneus ventricosus]